MPAVSRPVTFFMAMLICSFKFFAVILIAQKICSHYLQKQPFRCALGRRCFENMQSNFIEIALRYECSSVNLLHVFRKLYLRTPLDGCLCIWCKRLRKIQETSIIIFCWCQIMFAWKSITKLPFEKFIRKCQFLTFFIKQYMPCMLYLELLFLENYHFQQLKIH